MSTLNRSISFLERSGTALEKKLKRVGIETCQDLIFYFPRRFDDFSHVVSIGDLRPETTVTIRGRVDIIKNRRSRRSRMIVTEALVSDDTGSVKVVWFNQPFLTKNLREGDRVSLSGKTNDRFYDLQLVSPAYEKTGSDAGGWGQAQVLQSQKLSQTPTVSDPVLSLLHTGRLAPVYSLPAKITQKQFRTLIRIALDATIDQVEEYLPEEILKKESLPGIRAALETIHFPQSSDAFRLAERRFKLEELFLLQLHNAQARQIRAAQPAQNIPFDERATKAFIAELPFTLTKEQKEVAWEILRDIGASAPMSRLLHGDVGAGKTVVACIAMLNAVRAGYQCALMAPTEVLASQHYKTLRMLFSNFDIRIALVTAQNCELRIKNQELRVTDDELRVTIASGGVDIIIGTHALIQEKVMFKHLALVVVDEQHRFGVKQRHALREKNADQRVPHMLAMTATPIPRSLALTIYGDLDISALRTLPKGRKKVITKIVPQSYREWTYDFIRKHVAAGRQAFVICPIINESDTLGVRSVTEEYKKLTAGPFRDRRVALLHGRVKTKEKESVMAAFCGGEIDILVTTSVIEVGVDVPNATIMLIEGAERFGLAQLHQLRGRVGRAEHQSYCFLAPTDEDKEEIARLKAVVASNDGFTLAEKDLELRGEGDIYGFRQSGMPRLKIATLFDIELIQKAKAYAKAYASQLDRHPALQKRVSLLHDWQGE